MQRSLKIGLTGGMGCGKSTAAGMFSEFNVTVIDADSIARDLVQPCSPLLEQIISKFGPELVDRNGQLNRARLRSLVFENPQKRRWLEQLIHPPILAEMELRAKACRQPYCVLCIPLLVETHQEKMVDRILVIDLPAEIQIRRIKQRDQLSEREIEAVLQAQTDRQTRLATAHDIIDNSGDREQLKLQIEKLHKKYLRIASAN